MSVVIVVEETFFGLVSKSRLFRVTVALATVTKSGDSNAVTAGSEHSVIAATSHGRPRDGGQVGGWGTANHQPTENLRFIRVFRGSAVRGLGVRGFMNRYVATPP
jgi:hypothetical protein